MKIQIHNFGPISSFEFDLQKDINVIFGKNNLGKSYAITVIYLIFKNLISENFTRNSIEINLFLLANGEKKEVLKKNNSHFFSLLEKIENEINKKIGYKGDELDITAEVSELLNNIISKTFIENLENSLLNSFSSIENLSNKYTHTPFTIDLFYKDFKLTISNNKNKLIIKELKLNMPIVLKSISSNRQPKIKNEQIVVYNNKNTSTIDFFNNILFTLYVNLKNEVFNIINNIYFLPASRSGLYQALNAFSAVIAELSKSRNFITNKIELPNISEPVSDYFLDLSNISSKSNKTFADIVTNIEDDIIKGRIDFKTESKKIVFMPANIDIELDLAFTSSMISEIAPIVAFLKYIINLKDDGRHLFFKKKNNQTERYNLIFIEEPEAHLHPEIQIKLMEIFCKLTDSKIKIIMTTHSNYMFNKLSNLILDNKIDYEKVGSYLVRNTDKGSVIDADSMQAEEDGINDNNFANIAEELYQERISIYDKLNSKQ